MKESEALLIEVWNRLTSDWSRLTTFRKMGVLGEDAAKEAIHRSNTYFVQQQMLYGEHQSLLKDPEAFVRKGHAESLPRAMTESDVQNFRNTLHASTLVFAHLILDASIFDCLKICSLEAPNSWAGIIANRKASLKEVAEKGYETLLREGIQAEINRLERESLLAKVDRIFEVCRPKQQVYLTNGFRFNRDRLSALDELRHQVVHMPSREQNLSNMYDDLEFLQRSGLHIFVMVGKTYGLTFSGTEAFAALAKRSSGANRD